MAWRGSVEVSTQLLVGLCFRAFCYRAAALLLSDSVDPGSVEKVTRLILHRRLCAAAKKSSGFGSQMEPKYLQ